MPRKALLENPHLYYVGRENSLYNFKNFFYFMANAFYQSAVVFFCAFYLYTNDVGLDEIG
eukprot:Pgem_evm1s12707